MTTHAGWLNFTQVYLYRCNRCKAIVEHDVQVRMGPPPRCQRCDPAVPYESDTGVHRIEVPDNRAKGELCGNCGMYEVHANTVTNQRTCGACGEHGANVALRRIKQDADAS